jgi:hypothetical protein
MSCNSCVKDGEIYEDVYMFSGDPSGIHEIGGEVFCPDCSPDEEKKDRWYFILEDEDESWDNDESWDDEDDDDSWDGDDEDEAGKAWTGR